MNEDFLLKPWIKKCLAFHVVAFILVFTFVWPVTKPLWTSLDASAFHLLNGMLKGPRIWQSFWAVLNHSLMDWVGDFIMLTLFAIHIFSAPPGERKKRVAEFLLCVLYIAALVYFVNRILFRQNLQIPRESPTLVFSDSIRLSEYIDWLKIKDTSTKSFPGDHATTAISFALCFSTFAKRRLSWYALGYAILVSLPRMILGAHWLSDVLVGSGAISLICYAWVFQTPIRMWAIKKIDYLISSKKHLEKPLSNKH